MSVITWLKDLVLGKNGFEVDEQDEEIQQMKDQSQECLDRAVGHLKTMRQEFTKLQRRENPQDHHERG